MPGRGRKGEPPLLQPKFGECQVGLLAGYWPSDVGHALPGTQHACLPNATYGCAARMSLWTSGGCNGEFTCGEPAAYVRCRHGLGKLGRTVCACEGGELRLPVRKKFVNFKTGGTAAMIKAASIAHEQRQLWQQRGDDGGPQHQAPPGGSAPAASGLAADAVIVEPRLHLSKLPMVLNNFRAQLPASWPIHLFHEPDAPLPSWSTLPALRDALRESTLRLHALPATAKEMPRSRVFNRLEAGLPTQWRSPRHAPAATSWYNYWLTDPAFWANPSFEHPWLLLFEADTALCAHPSTPASAFLEGSAAYGSPAAYVGKRARAAPPPLAKLHQRQGMSPP